MNWLSLTRCFVLALVAGCTLPESSASAQKTTAESKQTSSASGKGSEAKSNDSKSSAGKSAESKSVDAKSAEAKTAESKTAESKSAAKSTEAKKSESAATASKSTSSKGSAPSPEEDKKIKSLIRSTMKSFSAAELTAEQSQRADELLPKAIKDFVVKRNAAGITDEMVKKHTAAQKEAKSSGKSAKEQTAMAFEASGMNEDQIKVFKSTQTALTKAKRDLAKTLSEEQLAKLPDQLKTVVKAGK